MEWWHWLAVGLILVALEMAASGGFSVIFFGIAAIAIGSLHLFGLAGPLWLQFLLFSILSVGSLLLFRNPIIRVLKLDGGSEDVDSLVGETAVPLEEIAPDAVGRAELRGSPWQARNVGEVPLQPGQRCRVERIDGLQLHLRAE